MSSQHWRRKSISILTIQIKKKFRRERLPIWSWKKRRMSLAARYNWENYWNSTVIKIYIVILVRISFLHSFRLPRLKKKSTMHKKRQTKSYPSQCNLPCYFFCATEIILNYNPFIILAFWVFFAMHLLIFLVLKSNFEWWFWCNEHTMIWYVLYLIICLSPWNDRHQ